MIYFDWMNRSYFGSFREGLWTFLHFPFHLALVLLVEGAAQFILWRKAVEVVASVNKLFLAAESKFTGTSSAVLSYLFSNVTNMVFEMYNPKFMHTIDDAQKAIYAIGNTTFNSTEQLRQITTLFTVIQDSLFDSFDTEAPKPMMMNSTMMIDVSDPNEEWSKNMDAFMLIVCSIPFSPCTQPHFQDIQLTPDLTVHLLLRLLRHNSHSHEHSELDLARPKDIRRLYAHRGRFHRRRCPLHSREHRTYELWFRICAEPLDSTHCCAMFCFWWAYPHLISFSPILFSRAILDNRLHGSYGLRLTQYSYDSGLYKATTLIW